MRIAVLLAVALLLTACHRAPLTCRSEYLYPDYLASAHVSTPDPYTDCYYGQQVIVSWNVPDCHPDQLKLTVRYGTRELDAVWWPIATARGHKIYRLINQEYWCNEGIVSYKAELYQQGELLTDWSHHLWTNIIEFQEER